MESLYNFFGSLGYHHPLHPTQINMPIGLVVGAFLLAIAAIRSKEAGVSAKHVILLAFLFLFPTVLTGFLDWWNFYGGAWIYPFSIKITLGIVLFVLLAFIWLLGRRQKGLTVALWGLCALAFLDAVALGYFGGEVVFGQQAPVVAGHTAGERVFRYNCSGCHPFGGNHVTPGHPVIGAHVLESAEALQAWIRKPEPPMPPFSAQDIPDEAAGQMTAYLQAVWGKPQQAGGEGGHHGEGKDAHGDQ